MEINLIQIILIISIIVVFGVLITLINIKKKVKTPVNKEQGAWQKIDNLNNTKKELLKKKEELSFKYSAKSIAEDTYSNSLKYINSELSKIESQINEEVTKLTALQKKQDTSNDLRFTNIKLKGELNEVKLEKESLAQRNKELENFVKNLSENNETVCNIDSETKNKYYELILSKYRNHINENERKTITELKNMVSDEDLTIKGLISKYKPIGYDYTKDYIDTIRKVYNYLKSEINVIKNDLRVLYWIDATQILKHKVCDQQDIAILFCAIMSGLNDQNATIEVVLLEDDTTHAIVKTKYKNTHYIFDLSQQVPFDIFREQDEEKLFKEYNYNNKKISKKIYSFNQNSYISYDDDE